MCFCRYEIDTYLTSNYALDNFSCVSRWDGHTVSLITRTGCWSNTLRATDCSNTHPRPEILVLVDKKLQQRSKKSFFFLEILWSSVANHIQYTGVGTTSDGCSLCLTWFVVRGLSFLDPCTQTV